MFSCQWDRNGLLSVQVFLPACESNITFKHCRVFNHQDACCFTAPQWAIQRPLLDQSLERGLPEITLGWQHQVQCSRKQTLMSTADPLFRVFYILQGVRPVQSHLNFCFCCPSQLRCLLGIILHWQGFFFFVVFFGRLDRSQKFLVPKMLS